MKNNMTNQLQKQLKNETKNEQTEKKRIQLENVVKLKQRKWENKNIETQRRKEANNPFEAGLSFFAVGIRPSEPAKGYQRGADNKKKENLKKGSGGKIKK